MDKMDTNLTSNLDIENHCKWRGDPLSPMLFLIAVDVLQMMIYRVNATLDMAISAKIESPILAFQYADDTAVVAHADLSTMITLKLVLRLFSKVSRLLINFDKSAFYPINLDQAETLMVTEVMGCAQTQLPIQYLGMPLTIRKPRKQDFIPLLEKIESRIEGWYGKLLSRGGRLQLINLVLCTVPIYIMTCFVLPKWVVKRIETLCRNFFWGKSQEQGKGLPLISWEVVCWPKCCGGFGVANIELRNKSLLLRWWWKATTQSESLWYSIIHMLRKHRPHHPYPKIWLVEGSFFWNQLIKLHPLFQSATRWIIGSGDKISYWYDCWGDSPLRRMKDGGSRPISQYISLNEALTEGADVLFYFTGTVPDLFDQEDELEWCWSATGKYSAASVYKLLISAGKTRWGFMEIWKSAAPSKVKILTQLLLHDRLLTREVLLTRGIQVDEYCVLCDECALETSHHLFFRCGNARAVWARFVDIMLEMDSVSETWEASRQKYYTSVMRKKEEWVVRFMSVLWSLWRQRNELIFRGTKLSSMLVANRAEEDARMWLKFCARRNVPVPWAQGTMSGTRSSSANDAII